MSALLWPGKEQLSAELKVVMQNFDIGILVRRVKPDSQISGLLNLDVDLRKVGIENLVTTDMGTAEKCMEKIVEF